MHIRNLIVKFNETATEEIDALLRDMQLIPAARLLAENKDLPQELRNFIGGLTEFVYDLFSSDLPELSDQPEDTLRKVSREFNLARLLRERAIFRLYLLINHNNEDGVPVFMEMKNPDTGAPFATQEDFIGWFCREAHVARSLVFGRIQTINRLLNIGMTIEQSFSAITSKPSAIRDVLLLVADWDSAGLEALKPGVAIQLARHMQPDMVEAVEKLVGEVEEDASRQDELNEVMKPLIMGLVADVAAHESTKDAMEMVREDILEAPTITYTWDVDTDTLIITERKRMVDENGTPYELAPVIVTFVSESFDIPNSIKRDLVARLPIKNKHMVK